MNILCIKSMSVSRIISAIIIADVMHINCEIFYNILHNNEIYIQIIALGLHLCLLVSSSYEENNRAEQWSRNVSALVRINRSLRDERGDRTRNSCHCACLRTDLLIFGVHEFNGKRCWPFASGTATWHDAPRRNFITNLLR